MNLTKRELELVRDALSFYMRIRCGAPVSDEARRLYQKVLEECKS